MTVASRVQASRTGMNGPRFLRRLDNGSASAMKDLWKYGCDIEGNVQNLHRAVSIIPSAATSLLQCGER